MNNVLQKIYSAKKGTYHSVTYQSFPVEKEGLVIRKETKGVYRVGVEYKSISRVAEAGLGNGSLRGKEEVWINYPFSIQSPKGIKIRLTSTFNDEQRSHTTYYITENGKPEREITKQEIEVRGLIRFDTKKKPLTVFTVFADNIKDFR